MPLPCVTVPILPLSCPLSHWPVTTDDCITSACEQGSCTPPPSKEWVCSAPLCLVHAHKSDLNLEDESGLNTTIQLGQGPYKCSARTSRNVYAEVLGTSHILHTFFSNTKDYKSMKARVFTVFYETRLCCYYAINKMNSIPQCSLSVEMHCCKHQVQLKMHQLRNNEHLNGPYEIHALHT